MLAEAFLTVSLWNAAASVSAPESAFEPIPVEKIADSVALDLALNGFGTGLDLISTDYAVNNGCVEGNPLAPRVEGRIALKIGLAAFRGSVGYWLRRHGHKTTADVFRWAGLATDLFITGHNLACAQ